jgi:uncharacterized protein YdcH (DUF465 family)
MIEKMVNWTNWRNNYRRLDMGDYTQRLKWLKETHQYLNKKIDTMEKTGKFTDEEISEMKRDRLKMKDEIERLEKEHA